MITNPEKFFADFIEDCRKLDSRIAIVGNSVTIGTQSTGDLDGYNLPYRVYLVTQLMFRCGSFA